MALKPYQIRMVENDTLPSLRGTVKEDDGMAADLTGGGVEVHINYATPLVKTATIAVPTTGVWVVEWTAGDIRVGTWTYEIQITDSVGNVRTYNRDIDTDKLLEIVIDSEVA